MAGFLCGQRKPVSGREIVSIRRRRSILEKRAAIIGGNFMDCACLEDEDENAKVCEREKFRDHPKNVRKYCETPKKF